MRPKGTSDELQRRRERAIALFEQGVGKAEIARGLGTSRASVTRWCQAYQRDGPKGIQARAAPGRPAKLSAKQKQHLRRRILKGAKANGFPTELWTSGRIVGLIHELFGVRYHVDSMPRFLAALGLACQRPRKRAVQRDQERIAACITRRSRPSRR